MSRRSMASPIAPATGPRRSGMPSGTPRSTTTRTRRPRPMVVLAVLVPAGLITVGLAAALSGGNSAPVSATAATPSTTTSAPVTNLVPAGPDCTMPAGDQNTGAEVIAAFEHAYYVLRSGAAAHALISPAAPSTAPFTVVATLDAGIATIADGTTYCYDIDTLRPDVYTLTLTESGTNGPGVQYRQRITTDVVGGRSVIASIDPA